MKQCYTMMAGALARAALANSVNAGENPGTVHHIVVSTQWGAKIDPGDYAQIGREFTAQRNASPTIGIGVEARRGPFAIEAGWTLEKTMRWRKTSTSQRGAVTAHAAEVETGGLYMSASLDVAEFKGTHLYVKCALAAGPRWETTVNSKLTDSAGGGTMAATGLGARFGVPDSRFELRAEIVLNHDSDAGTETALRASVASRF